MELRILVVLLFLFSGVHSQQLLAPGNKTVDFSSVDAFWKAHQMLKVDKTLTESEWDQFFNTSYYKFYANWGQRAYIQRMLSNAFMPSKAENRDSVVRQNNWEAATIKHLISAETKKNELDSFRKKLEHQDFMGEAALKAGVYLPVGTINKYSDMPEVAVGIYQPDGNADKSIAVDLLLAMGIDFVGFVAHEMHHYYVYKLRENFKQDKNDSTYLLVKAIDQLQLEGLADLIDKPTMLETKGKGFPSQLFEIYNKHYSNPIFNLRKIDSLLKLIAKDPPSTEKNSKLINDLLPLGGHPHGYYMAKMILEKEGKQTLLKTIKNPFDFIRLYNSVAQKTPGAFVFSKSSMDYLKKLEETHILK